MPITVDAQGNQIPVVDSMPGSGAQYIAGGVPVQASSAGLFTPVAQPLAALGATNSPEVAGTYANIAWKELEALIQYRNAVLAQQTAQADRQNALASAAAAQQQGQFDKQLFFNEQAQRAQERQAAAQQDLAKASLAFQMGDAATKNTATERARQTTELLGRYSAADNEAQLAQQEALQRQQLAVTGFSAAEQARQAQQGQALQVANLLASLRGPSNAFQQLKVQGLLGQTGQSNLLGALAGTYQPTRFAAPGAAPEAASLDTMARDAGAQPSIGGPSQSPGFSDAAGIQGLLRVANQNASYVPTDPTTGQPSGTYAALMNQLLPTNIAATEAISGDRYGPGSSTGAHIIKGWQDLLVARNGQIPSANDPAVLKIWTDSGFSPAQAQVAANYAASWAKQYGTFLDEGQLNDMWGQISVGQAPDPAKWRNPGPAAATPPGSGETPVAPPSSPGVPAAPLPYAPIVPLPTGAPTSGGGSSIGARVLAAVQALVASGQPIDDSHAIDIWRQMGATAAQGAALHAASKGYYGQYGSALNESQLNDLWGQISSGQDADPSKWRQPAPVAPPPGTPTKPAAALPTGTDTRTPGTPVPIEGNLARPTPTYDNPAPDTSAPIVGQSRPGVNGGVDVWNGTAWTNVPSRAPGSSGATVALPSGLSGKGWTDPTTGMPAVSTPDGRAGYFDAATGKVIDGSGATLWTAPPAPTALGVEGPARQRPDVTYTYTGSGFTGTDGSQFDANWNKVTPPASTGAATPPATTGTGSYVAPTVSGVASGTGSGTAVTTKTDPYIVQPDGSYKDPTSGQTWTAALGWH